MSRVLVIGLDGATFDVINPLLEAGQLPNLARLQAEGITASLQSTHPPNSAPAWTSCRTGVNPGKHGIFNFWRCQAYEWPLVSSSDVQVPAIENILSRQGLRVCTINVPLTFPPQPVNGIVISGHPTPGPESCFTYPAGLHAELLARVGDYLVDGFGIFNTTTPTNYLGQLYECHRRRRHATRYLLAREDWDYFMVVFTLPDKIQHRFWHFRERWQQRDTSELAQRFGPVIDQCYTVLDETVGLLLDEVGDETTVLVISDHGFGPCQREVHLNVWLREQGYLCLKFAHQLWARQIHWERKENWLMPRPRLEIGMPRRRVHWNRTRAFGSLYVKSPGIWLNLKGRDPQGIVTPGRESEQILQTLTDELLTLTGCDGQPLFKHIYRPEQLYHGPHVAQASDLLLDAQDSYRVMGQFTLKTMQHSPEQRGTASGNHRMTGILLARGPGVDTRALPETPHIMDIAPTVLQSLGEPVPTYMDGRPLFG